MDLQQWTAGILLLACAFGFGMFPERSQPTEEEVDNEMWERLY